MPVTAWIDERHLPPLGLANAWGYNPVVPMALDPRLAPGGVAELRDTVAALRAQGIGVILDLVLNHTGESDLEGADALLPRPRPRRLCARARRPPDQRRRHRQHARLRQPRRPRPRARHAAALRHPMRRRRLPLRSRPGTGAGAGVRPRRTVSARDRRRSCCCPAASCIAEPWDCAGYQLGRFPDTWLEWNDRYRDDVRRFWRGDGGAGGLATRLSGSTDVFGADRTRSVSFVAAHDGFTLHDVTAYAERHNHANGEDNRDGHHGEISWNAGEEGRADFCGARALLATLYDLRDDHADRRRRVRTHAGRQQQRLRAGQCDYLARLARSGQHRARNLRGRPRRASLRCPTPPSATTPAASASTASRCTTRIGTMPQASRPAAARSGRDPGRPRCQDGNDRAACARQWGWLETGSWRARV
ncbi:hypothetical protein AB5I41_16585 [Sphingomonas sp. MMS24-JH45]